MSYKSPLLDEKDECTAMLLATVLIRIQTSTPESPLREFSRFGYRSRVRQAKEEGKEWQSPLELFGDDEKHLFDIVENISLRPQYQPVLAVCRAIVMKEPMSSEVSVFESVIEALGIT